MDNKKEIKQDWLKFSTKDVTQTFIAVSIINIVLLVTSMIDVNSFTQLMSVNIGGFYAEKLTNIRNI